MFGLLPAVVQSEHTRIGKRILSTEDFIYATALRSGRPHQGLSIDGVTRHAVRKVE